MRTLMIATLLLSFTAFLTIAAGAQKEAEKRLLEAELLELASGDLEKAASLYTSLADDEKVAGSVRARALLNLARCHRKRGQLDSAEKTLTRLVRDFPTEAVLIRRARTFLRELRTGKSDNPKFDWLGALEKNPEIQARVFELSMNLARPASPEGQRALAQLLVLGKVAAPLLDRLCDASRSLEHRRFLAGLLVNAGRYERLPVLFEGDFEESRLLGLLVRLAGRLPALDPEQRKRFFTAINSIKVDERRAGYVDYLRLWAGDRSELAEKLFRIAGTEDPDDLYYNSNWGDDLEPWLLRSLFRKLVPDRAFAAELAAVMTDPRCNDGLLDLLFESLQGRVGSVLGDRVVDPLMRVSRDFQPENYAPQIMAALEKDGRTNALVRLAQDERTRDLVAAHFDEKYDPLRRPVEVPVKWAAVLRAGGLHRQLHQLAEGNEKFIGPFVGFLAARAKEGPKYIGHRRRDSDWKPSAAYIEALMKVPGSDASAQAIALEAFAHAAGGPDYLEALERMVLAPADLHVREFALLALLRRFAHRPEIGPRVARILLADYERRKDWTPDVTYYRSPLRKVMHLGTILVGMAYQLDGQGVQFWRRDAKGNAQRYQVTPEPLTYHRRLVWVRREAGEAALERLFPVALRECGARADRDFFKWFLLGIPASSATRILAETMPEVTDPKIREAALAIYGRKLTAVKSSPAGVTFLKDAATDRRIKVEERVRALRACWPDSRKWFDWTALFASDDPLTSELISLASGGWTGVQGWILRRPKNERRALMEALLRNPDARVRRWPAKEMSFHSTQNRLAFGERFLRDADHVVQRQGAQLLTGLTDPDPTPMLLRILTDKRFEKALVTVYPQVFSHFAFDATEEAIVPLAGLLDHRSADIRVQALSTLRKIRETLEERKAWKKLVEDMKNKERK